MDMACDERRIFDYFVIAGLPANPEELSPGAAECGYKNAASQAPITDICVIFPGFQEEVPEGFTMVDTTPFGFPADLNHGSLRTPSCFLCYRRGYHKPPLVDIGVLYEGKERVMVDSQILQSTPYGRPANVSNSSQPIYLTYRRAPTNAKPFMLAVTDMCVILENKAETAPHTFCKIPKNLNKGMIGSEVFICYKKSLASANNIAYQPALLDRFPAEDHPSVPLPPNIAIFTLPMGALLECWPAKCEAPLKQFSTFVLTDKRGQKFYGAAVTFWQRYERELSTEQMEKLGVNPETKTGSCSDNSSTNDPSEQKTFNVNKCICLLSRYPFFTAFKRYLLYLYRMSDPSVTNQLPIERFISHLMYEVPFPTSRRPRVLVQLGNEAIFFDNPEDSPLPISGASYIEFLKLLGPDHSMYVLLLALTEQKLLLHSLRPAILTSVAESVTSLLFPCRWQCPYIPQCPLDLAGVLHAPLPFIAGVDSRYFEMYDDPPRDVTCVDLDTNTISNSEVRKMLKPGLLPKRPARLLRQTLETLFRRCQEQEWHTKIVRSSQELMPLEVDYRMAKTRKELELEIQEAFLRFMAAILKGYQNFLKPIKSAPNMSSTDSSALFDIQGFLRSRDKSAHEFYKVFVNTQLFIRFIEERSFFVDNDTFLQVFDEVCERVDPNSDKVESKLVDFESSFSNDHTLFIPPPEVAHPQSSATLIDVGETEGIEQQHHFIYNGFPDAMNQDWFFLDDLVLPSLDSDAIDAAGGPTGNGFQKDRPGSFRAKYSLAGGVPLDSALSGSVGEFPPNTLGVSGAAAMMKDSPAVRRTKQEAKSALKLAREAHSHPNKMNWAKCLLSYGYSLWFIQLPSYVARHVSKTKALRIAFKILDRLQSSRLPMTDEVCYRILIQLCFQYNQPIMAVKAFIEMRQHGIQPNAITYGFYNRAVLEAKWPSVNTLNAQRYWLKLRLGIRATAILNKALRERRRKLLNRQRRPMSQHSITSAESDQYHHLNPAVNILSRLNKIDPSLDNDNLSMDSTVLSSEIAGSMGSCELGSTGTLLLKPASGSKCKLGTAISDHGYISQTTEDSLLSLQESTNPRGGAPSRGKRSQAGITASLEEDFALFDELLSSRRCGSHVVRSNSSRNNSESSSAIPSSLCGSVTVDSPAGVLMTTDRNGLHFERGFAYEKCASVIHRSGGAVAALKGPVGNDVRRPHSLDVNDQTPLATTENNNDQKQLSIALQKDGLLDHGLDAKGGDQPDDLKSSDAGIQTPKSVTPTRVARSTVTAADPLGALYEGGPQHISARQSLTSKAAKAKQQNNLAALSAVEMPAPLIRDTRNLFQDSSSDDEVPPQTPSSFAAMRGFISKIQSPVSHLLVRSKTVDTSFGGGETTPLTAGAAVSEYQSPAATPSSAGSNTSSGFVGMTASMLHSKIGLLRNKESYNKLKNKVSQVVGELSRVKGDLDQISSPLKQSLTSLSIDMSLSSSGIPAMSFVGSGSYYLPTSFTTGNLSSAAYHGSGASLSVSERDDVLSVEGFFDEDDIQEDDPAFQLSSGDTGSLLSFDVSNVPCFNPSGSFGGSQTEIAAVPAPFSATTTAEADAVFSKTKDCLEVLICSATRCQHCETFLYDEEIMAGWSFNDHDLNTCCVFCSKKLVPILTVVMRPTTSKDLKPPGSFPLADQRSKGLRKGSAGANYPGFTSSSNSLVQQRLRASKTLSVSSHSVKSVPGNLLSLSSKAPPPQQQTLTSGSNQSKLVSQSAENLLMPPPPSDFTPKRRYTTVPQQQQNSASVANDVTMAANDVSCNADANTEVDANTAKINRKLFATCETVLETSATVECTGSAEPRYSVGNTTDEQPPASNSEKQKKNTDEDVLATVPYLSPLVLRKELENVLAAEGDDCFQKIGFLKEHPILFWNLLYVFQRLSVPSLLKGWVKAAHAMSRRDEQTSPSSATVDSVTEFCWCSENVVVNCVYDLDMFHADERAICATGAPLYHQWRRVSEQKTTSTVPNSAANDHSTLLSALSIDTYQLQKATLVQVVDNLKVSNILKALLLLLNEFRKTSSCISPKRNSPNIASCAAATSPMRTAQGAAALPNHRSLYRELLFLAIVSCDSREILYDNFDREFVKAYAKVPPGIAVMLNQNDKPPMPVVRACRRIYMPLNIA